VPNFELKTLRKQFLGSLPLDIAFPGSIWVELPEVAKASPATVAVACVFIQKSQAWIPLVEPLLLSGRTGEDKRTNKKIPGSIPRPGDTKKFFNVGRRNFSAEARIAEDPRSENLSRTFSTKSGIDLYQRKLVKIFQPSFFSSSLTLQRNKLECLFLPRLFCPRENKAVAYPSRAPQRWSRPM
jgi:hypothetical protein